MDLLEPWRRRKVMPHIRGRLLDVGCGFNNLVRSYGSGVGVDVFRWPGIDVLIGDAAALPFRDATFDTVSIMAALNHIPNRRAALEEVRRVLHQDGRLIVTMIGPLTGIVAHAIFRQDEEARGGMRPGEKNGLTGRDLIALLTASGFVVRYVQRFQLGLNSVYVASKAASVLR
jgi:SAM-dependent methyltransferase